MERFRYIINILIAGLLLITVAINRDARIAGTSTSDLFSAQENSPKSEIEETRSDGTTVVSSAHVAKGVAGYGGATPIRLHLKSGKIEKIVAEKNSESPDFMEVVNQSGLLDRWNGLTPEEALRLKVDAVSGATLSSTALITTVQKTLAHATQNISVAESQRSLSIKTVIGLLVIALGVAISFVRSRALRIAQLVLNVVVLGFWCGSFLSLSQWVNWCSSGVNVATSLVPLTLLIVALLMPLFDRKGHYCSWHCPMGSLQELAGKCVARKWVIPNRWLRYLNTFQTFVLWGLLCVMWLGVGFEVMDYEVFSAFLFASASPVVLTMAILFIALSCFVNRPYCRFVCPTGSLLRFTTSNK